MGGVGASVRVLLAVIVLSAGLTAASAPAVAAAEGPTVVVNDGLRPRQVDSTVVFEVDPSMDISEEASVFLTVGGVPFGTEVSQCVLPVGDTLEGGRCDYGFQLPLDEQGDVRYPIYPLSVMYLEGEPVDCRVEDCALVLFDGSQAPWPRFQHAGPHDHRPHEGPRDIRARDRRRPAR